MKEPCLPYNIRTNVMLRFDLCRDIITLVKNESNISTYDESCNLKAACFSEFGDNFTCSAESEPQKNIPTAEADYMWIWSSLATFLVMLLIAAIIIVYLVRKLKKQEEKIAYLVRQIKEQKEKIAYLVRQINEDDQPRSIMHENTLTLDVDEQIYHFTESTSNESVSLLPEDEVNGDSSHESMAPTRELIHNLPPASTTSPSVFFPKISRHIESLNDSNVSGGSQHNEDSQSTSTTSNEHVNNNHHRHPAKTDNHQSQRSTYTRNEHINNNHHGHPAETDNHQNQRSFHTSNEHDNKNNHGHPAETDNQIQRSIYMSSTEPSDHQGIVVTGMSSVHQPRRPGLE
jgi:hypothetical protein